jgi:hypothetical protein
MSDILFLPDYCSDQSSPRQAQQTTAGNGIKIPDKDCRVKTKGRTEQGTVYRDIRYDGSLTAPPLVRLMTLY